MVDACAQAQAQAITRHEEVVTRLTQCQTTITDQQSSLHSKIDEVISRLATLETTRAI